MSKSRSILKLPISGLVEGDNPRQEFDQVALAELMHSMKGHGLLSPIGVRALPHGKYQIVFGHRRYLAAKRLGWDFIDGVEVDVTDERDSLIKTSTENVIRENVSLPEQGRIFQALLKKGLTGGQIAVRMGCSKVFVRNALEAFNRIPAKYHDKITYGTRGQMGKPGSIPASVALAAADIRKKHTLTDAQIGQLMDWASKHQVTSTKMKAAGKMMSEGMEAKKAMAQIDFMKHVVLSMTMRIDVIKRLQAKYKMGIHDILYKYLQSEPEFELLPTRFEKLEGKSLPREIVIRKKARKNR